MELDYYQVLGIEPAADLNLINMAYRYKATQCHPDRGGSHDRMKLVNEAWEVIVKPGGAASLRSGTGEG
jgi:curved DNA-binding protein CbpA